ncbi:MAG: hypothetical protein ACRC68_15600 [Clostridium sp.]
MISHLCDLACVSRSGYYNYFSDKSTSYRVVRDEQDEVIRDSKP